VFEALAHSAFAHRSFLAVNIPEHEDMEELPDDRIVQECKRLGLGYMIFFDPADYDTFDIVESARLNEPDPYEVDNFVNTQISASGQEELRGVAPVMARKNAGYRSIRWAAHDVLPA
jgi:hypothetical protein